MPNSQFTNKSKFSNHNYKNICKLKIKNLKFQRGFTLIELLVVIAIISILATLLVANFNAGRERARDAQRKSDLKNIQTALRLFYNDKTVYPVTTGAPNYRISGCGTATSGITGLTECAPGLPWTTDGVTYMSNLPGEPLSGGAPYYYTRSATDGDVFTLAACLENRSDDRGVATTAVAGYPFTSLCTSGKLYVISQ